MHKNIADVKGIQCWGAHIGIKSKRRDLAIIYSTTPASAAAVFTKNIVVAEPLKINRENIKQGKLRAFVINSGNANCCTGEQGRMGAEAMLQTAADTLNVEPAQVFIASTGVIGVPFPTEKVCNGIRENVRKITSSQVAGSLAAHAILTTDTIAKEGFMNFKIGGNDVNLAGIAKGSGMIHPNMATMLAFIVSDAAISSPLLNKALKEVADKTFNMITVDGDTSTNDMVTVMCNGLAKNPPIEKEDKYYITFKTHLEKLCAHLAKLIVTDGEGATKFIEYKVTGAPGDVEARQIVRTISNSNLVKTAIFGRDPNWGRIVAAAGRAGVVFDPDKVDLYIGSQQTIQILKMSQPVEYNQSALKKSMHAPSIKVLLDLNQGEGQAVGWGSDFSYEYVRINAEYTT